MKSGQEERVAKAPNDEQSLLTDANYPIGEEDAIDDIEDLEDEIEGPEEFQSPIADEEIVMYLDEDEIDYSSKIELRKFEFGDAACLGGDDFSSNSYFL